MHRHLAISFTGVIKIYGQTDLYISKMNSSLALAALNRGMNTRVNILLFKTGTLIIIIKHNTSDCFQKARLVFCLCSYPDQPVREPWWLKNPNRILLLQAYVRATVYLGLFMLVWKVKFPQKLHNKSYKLFRWGTPY